MKLHVELEFTDLHQLKADVRMECGVEPPGIRKYRYDIIGW